MDHGNHVFDGEMVLFLEVLTVEFYYVMWVIKNPCSHGEIKHSIPELFQRPSYLLHLESRQHSVLKVVLTVSYFLYLFDL